MLRQIASQQLIVHLYVIIFCDSYLIKSTGREIIYHVLNECYY